ncbi:MAG: radical SAM protein [Thermoplasmata archaeon]|nr:MAG: radical SAM protein [Thermoplasmata archaeon]
MKQYPRILTKDSEPFDPLELARETEKIVCKGDARKYTAFYATGVYGGIATGYTVGCCLRCFYCWVDWSRDFPERLGEFYSAEQTFGNLKKTAHKFGVRKLRISGAEPTLGREHLLALLKLVEESEFGTFILETNGILFGADEKYVKELKRLTKPHIRVSLKAGTPEGFERRTGATKASFELPYRAIKFLLDADVSFHVAAMTDRRVMSNEERKAMIRKLSEIDYNLASSLEEEHIDPYDTTLERLKYAGVELEWRGRSN